MLLMVGRALTFFMGPAGRVVLLALAFAAWTLYQRHDAASDCQADYLRDELLESQRQLEKANKIAKAARERADQTQAEMAETERLFDELRKDLKKSPEQACSISPDTRKRLLDIK